MKKIIGILIILIVFAGLFILVCDRIGLNNSIIVFVGSLILTAILSFACYLIASD